MSRILLILTFLTGFITTGIAQTTYTWVGGSVDNYQTAANWSPARITPATTDILAFDVTTPVSVLNVPNQTIGAIQIIAGTDAVTFGTNLITNVLTLSSATPILYTTAGSILAG
ncbi:MAG: hypothetical protein RL172_1899, partial [Bacteroidota bacterium]